MKIKKEEFIKMLETLKPGLSNKDIIEHSDSITFTGKRAISYNDIIAVTFPFKTEFNGTVKADKLLSHVTKAKADKEGYLKVKNKKSELVISSGNSKAGLPINEDTIDLEELGDIPTKWKKLPGDFTTGIRLSTFSAGTDATEPKLLCLHINKDQIQSSNGDRCFRYKMNNKIKKEFLIPATSAFAIINHPIKKYSVTKNWLHFKTKDKVIISLRMYADVSYPDTDFLFDLHGKSFEFPEKLRETINEAVNFIGDDEEDRNIQVHIKKDKFKIKSKSVHGWFDGWVKAKSKKKASFEINPFFLQDILKSSNKAILDKSKNLLKFKSDKWEYVVNIALD